MVEQLGRYVLERKLATGGMAEIFLARQLGPGGFEKLCVIKRMLSSLAEDEHFVRMFFDEARLAAQLNHPNIAQIYDFGEQAGTYFLAMEYVPGANLRSIVKECARRREWVPYPAAVRMVAQAAVALDYAHKATGPDGEPLHLIHRDVSPQNILLAQQGVVKLIDFGVAKAATASQRTATGMIKGKIPYMSPEQLRGQPLDPRSDLYGLGLVLYELLSSRRAIQGANEVALMHAAMKMQIPPLDTLRADLPPALVAIVARAVQKDRDQRHADAAELASDLERFLVQQQLTVSASDLIRLLPELPPVAMRVSRTPSATSAPLLGVSRAPEGLGLVDTSPSTATVIDPEFAQRPLPPPRPPNLQQRAQPAPAPPPIPQAPPGPAAQSVAPAPGPRPSASFEIGSRELTAPGDSSASLVRAGIRQSRLPWTVAGGILAAGIALVVFLAFNGGQEPAPAPAPPKEQQASAPKPQPVPAAPPKDVVAAEVAAPIPQPGPQAPPVQEPAVAAAPQEAEPPARRERRPAPRVVPAAAPSGAATLQIFSSPPTSVWIDGARRGQTPLTVSLGSGDHTLVFRDDKLGLQHSRTVRLEKGEQRREEWRAARGKIAFRAVPYAEVFLAGKSLGLTPLAPLELYEGTYSFRFENKETRRTEARQVTVVPGAETVVKVDLREK